MTRYATSPDPPPAEHGAPVSVLLLAALLVLVAAVGTVDIVLDRPTTALSAHVVVEVALITLSLGAAMHLWLGWRRASRAATHLQTSLAARSAERDAWRDRARSALAGLARAIDEQFDAWHLTPAEREVALLLLKGHGHKRIAAMTGRSERTVRQHAVAVYEKAGLSSRAELAAFFLEDLLLPRCSGIADDHVG